MPKTIFTRRLFLAAIPASAVVAVAAVRGDGAMYVGGTLKNIPEKTEGELDASDEAAAKFTSKKGDVAIEYAKIETIEYGQKAGRRVGVALVISPVALFSKKRKHYVTIGFVDADGKKQGAVFEVAKGRVRALLNTLETRSGKKIEYESDDAKKHVGN
ncbi:MAG TPA: hypothetical protein VN428_11290 [Bryobacteraceae bacterium]|nr:hypothetical protein [Bryobacteraceae bacterium]